MAAPTVEGVQRIPATEAEYMARDDVTEYENGAVIGSRPRSRHIRSSPWT